TIIVLYHYIYRYAEINNFDSVLNKYSYLDNFGTVGVISFFIIFGLYVIPKYFDKLYKFYLKKILNLWPQYIFALTIIFISSFILPFGDRKVTFIEYMLNIFFINNLPGPIRFVDGAHWFLFYLFIYIIIIGLLIKFKLSNSVITYIIWLIISFILY